jgi:hypothetical protein
MCTARGVTMSSPEILPLTCGKAFKASTVARTTKGR